MGAGASPALCVQVRTKQDMASERIGLRTIEVKGAGVYLNGKRIL